MCFMDKILLKDKNFSRIMSQRLFLRPLVGNVLIKIPVSGIVTKVFRNARFNNKKLFRIENRAGLGMRNGDWGWNESFFESFFNQLYTHHELRNRSNYQLKSMGIGF